MMMMPRELKTLQKFRFAPNARVLSSLLLRKPSYRHNTGIDHTKVLGALRYSSIFEKFTVQAQLQVLRKNVDSSQTSEELERHAILYLQLLRTVEPKEVLSFLERYWELKKIPVSERFLKEYLKAAADLKKMDSVNISGLLSLLQEGNSNLTSDRAALASFLVSNSKNASENMRVLGSVSDPMYVVSVAKVHWWDRVAKALPYVFLIAGAYMIYTYQDKVASSSAGSSLSARLGMGSAVHQAEASDKTFDDVIGIDEAKADLQEIVLYLKDPKRFTRLGGKLPKGVLLTGPPGTGKTLLARAIAGEAGVPFFHASGSEFEEMFVGVGAKRVRELFDTAKTKSPCIIFIDEIDAIGGARQLKDQSATKMTLNQLLVEMDGFKQNSGVTVIAATNFPDTLDSALIRPGRFDKIVHVPMPDVGGRKAILEFYGKKVKLDPDVDMEQIARGTPGFTGADLFNLVNQAALKAAVDNLKAIGMSALEYAKDKILMGAERKSAVISPESIKMTAFHEAGHALVALKTDGAEPIHKATIVPRGQALGMVMQLPDGDRTSISKKQMLARLDVCMGGRVAEELVFGAQNVTSGASNDIMQATRLAKAMVTKYGLGEKAGVYYLEDKENLSEDARMVIDAEVKQILQRSHERATLLLETHRAQLDLLAHGLIEHESLSGAEIVEIVDGKTINLTKRSQKPSRELQKLPYGPSSGGKPEEASVPVSPPSTSASPTPPTSPVQPQPSPPATAEGNTAAAAPVADKKSIPSANSSAVRGPPKN